MLREKGNNFGIFRELGQRKKTKTKQIDYNRIQICPPLLLHQRHSD